MNPEIRPFNTVEDFVDSLNSYVGDNIWNDLIYGSEILDDAIDEPASTDGDGAIHLESGRMIAYEEQRREWAAYLPFANELLTSDWAGIPVVSAKGYMHPTEGWQST